MRLFNVRLFDPRARLRSLRNEQLYAAYELAYTAVDFMAALCFVTGSLLHFTEELAWLRDWLFLAGSILFAVKPTLRFAREIQYARRGYIEWLARRVDG